MMIMSALFNKAAEILTVVSVKTAGFVRAQGQKIEAMIDDAYRRTVEPLFDENQLQLFQVCAPRAKKDGPLPPV